MGGDENQEERIRKNRKEERSKWVSVSNHFHLTFKYPRGKLFVPSYPFLKNKAKPHL